MTAPTRRQLARLLRSVERPVVLPLYLVVGLALLLFAALLIGGLLFGNALP